MARTKKSTPGPFYYVYTMSYASAEVKARVDAGGYARPGEIVAKLAPLVRSEYKASQAFFRACRQARRNPLAFEVLVDAGQETIIDVTITH